MSRPIYKDSEHRKIKIISSLLQELLSSETGECPDKKWVIKVSSEEDKHQETAKKPTHSSPFDNDTVKSIEEGRSDEQFSQSSISGNPSPFIGSVADLNIIETRNQKRVIRNKSWDDF